MSNLAVVIIGSSGYSETYKTLRNIKILKDTCKTKVQVYLLSDDSEKQRDIIRKKAKELISDIEIPVKTFLDFSEVREHVTKTCKESYIIFIYSGNYLSLDTFNNFYKICNLSNHQIYLTEKKVFFEKEYYTEDNIASSDTSFSNFSFLIQDLWNLNPWGSTFFISKKDLEGIELSKINHEFKVGTEIITFFCNCLSNGMEFVIIPQTISFYRKNMQSLRLSSDYVTPKIELFAPENFEIKNQRIISEVSEKNRNHLKKTLHHWFPKFCILFSNFKKKYEFILAKINDKEDKRSIIKKIPSVIFPNLYLKIFVIKERIKKLFGEKNEKQFYPLWFVNEWKLMNNIEPILFPPENRIYEKVLLTNINLDNYLQEMYSHFPSNIDYLIVCPWLKRGGADKLAINLIKGIKKIFPNKEVGLLLTEKTNSEIKSMLPEDIYFFDFGNSFPDINAPEREALLLRFIIQNSPKKTININSHSLFNILLKYSKPISLYTKIYCFCFSPSKAPNGQLTGFSFDFIPFIIDDLETVFTDNTNIINVLVEMFGLDKNKFSVIYQPVEIEKYIEKTYLEKREWNILWASRIDYEKLPSVLEKIIAKSSGGNLVFHIYGNSLLDKQFPLRRFNKYKHAFTYGAYVGGLSGIDYSKYDLFLYTSEFDGMPNTVLEALSLGIPVISSNVGGIKEVIEDGVTGFLVDDIYDETKYFDLLERVIERKNDLNRIRLNASKKLNNQHSWDVYLDRLKEILA